MPSFDYFDDPRFPDTRAGLNWDQAILQYLVDGTHAVERSELLRWGEP